MMHSFITPSSVGVDLSVANCSGDDGDASLEFSARREMYSNILRWASLHLQ